MLLLLRDYATFDYAKRIRDFGARLCYLYASIIGYATLGPFPFAFLAQLCYHYASIIRDPRARLC